MKGAVRVMEFLAAACAVAFVVLLFANEPDSPAASGGGDTRADGAAVFADSCARCHGSGGEGGLGPQLSDGEVVDAYPDPADQVAVVTNGRGAMPAFGGRLSSEEIDAVVEYTRQL